MTSFIAYHGVSAVTHQQQVDDLSAQGYRPVSLSVSGTPSDARYSTIWILRTGPPWVAIHGFSAHAYQQRFDELTAQGFAPVIVTATGAVSEAIFAAIFEHGVRRPWFARHHLRWDPFEDPNTLIHENQRAIKNGFIPRCLVAYGEEADIRFTGIWIQNDDSIPWTWWLTTGEAYQRFFTALVLAGTRPAYVAPAPGGRILSVFRDEPIGAWWARHGLSSNEYQAEFDIRVATGSRPVLVQSQGTGDATRYAAVFAFDDAPVSRHWRVTGDLFSAAEELDDLVHACMQANAIRAGSVALARNGQLIAGRGYTWAEADYKTIQPDTRFRVASLSKIFTAAAIQRLVTDGKLSWDTPAFPFLGITVPILFSQVPDPHVNTITVEQLTRHTGGLQRDFDSDLRTIASLLGLSFTPSRNELVHYLYGQPLDHAPGTGEPLYSNSAFTVLTSLVERASGLPYLSYLSELLLRPVNIADVSIGRTIRDGRLSEEVPTYDHPGVKDSQLDLSPGTLAPNAYGGDFVLEVVEGSGGLIASPASIARFIGGHAVWDVGARAPNTRYGTLDGTCAGAVSRADGLDFAFVFNRRVSDVVRNDLTASLNKLFDQYADQL